MPLAAQLAQVNLRSCPVAGHGHAHRGITGPPDRKLRQTSDARLLVSDTFSRRAPSGWGVADRGGSYSSGRTGLSVTNGAGRITLLSRGVTRGVALPRVHARNVDMRFRISLNRMPTANGVAVTVVLRKDDAGQGYRARARIAGNGTVWLAILRARNGSLTNIGDEVRISGIRVKPGSSLWLRARVSGTSPTLIHAMAWAPGLSRPNHWQVSRRDNGRDSPRCGRRRHRRDTVEYVQRGRPGRGRRPCRASSHLLHLWADHSADSGPSGGWTGHQRYRRHRRDRDHGQEYRRGPWTLHRRGRSDTAQPDSWAN